MEKNCFVIMPISESGEYKIGHFKRVYEHIIKPACLRAGFNPIRSDDILNTNYIALDILKRIITSDMAICDLSSKNPNVFYELGIRQAFNQPITLLRDSITERVFDIQGFRDIEYDVNLRIDNVESSINQISKTINNTYKSKGQEINSLISLLGVEAAKITDNIEISNDTELILNAVSSLEAQLSRIEKFNLSTLPLSPSFNIDETDSTWHDLIMQDYHTLTLNDIVEHNKFGRGKVLKMEGAAHNLIATILFQYGGEKKLMLNYSRLKRLVKSK